MKKKKVYLTLQNGKVFQGFRFGAEGDVTGELVFSTGMVGYMETLTDPSNYGQIIVQTFPLIGNYGMIRSDIESKKARVSAYIVREICDNPSNFRMEGSLEEYLLEEGVVGIYGLDTRELTKVLREEGAMNARISDKPLNEEAIKEMGASEEIVKEVLTLYTIQAKMYDAIIVDTDRNVSDEEAAAQVGLIGSIEGFPVYCLFMEYPNEIRIRIRSRGPRVDKLANHYGGGGHEKAAGAHLDSWDELDTFITELGNLNKYYQETGKDDLY